MRQDPEQLRTVLTAVVEAMGYELVGVECHPHKGNALLRVYVDKEAGVTVDDCAQVSHQLSGVLDVEDLIPGNYTLEVSSPGLDRPLFGEEDFVRFAGCEVRIQLTALQHGRRNFKGRLLGVRDGQVVLVSEGQELLLPLAAIHKARLIPSF